MFGIAMHEDEVTQLAQDRIGAEPVLWLYRECPGCTNFVRHTDTRAHATTCEALRSWVMWEADAHRDAQPARMSGGAS